MTTIKLEHNLYTGPPVQEKKQPYLKPTTTARPSNNQRPEFPRDLGQTSTSSIPIRPQRKKPVNAFLSDAEVCGKSVTATTGLIFGGTPFQKGDFPWLAAFFYQGVFHCGGTLISSKHVITAAHCVFKKGTPSKLLAEDSYFVLGKHNLEVTEESEVSIGVSQFIIHHDWDTTHNRYDADIAVAVLSSNVQYTPYIRPICCSSMGSMSDIVGEKLTLAGWGKTDFESDLATDEPTMVSIPVVSDGDCLRSHELFSYITSKNTFCAGTRNENIGPCNGNFLFYFYLKRHLLKIIEIIEIILLAIYIMDQ
jgi:hypothetical protein